MAAGEQSLSSHIDINQIQSEKEVEIGEDQNESIISVRKVSFAFVPEDLLVV